MSDEWVMVPRDLLQRVDAALQRHLDRHAPMRIPVDQTDSDLVQSDVQALISAPAAPQQAEPVAWRDHVEQRLHNWRQRTMNRSGDRLALDDMMSKESIDDLIDYVCDEWSDPVAPQQSEPVWVRPDQLQKARQAPFLCRVSPTKDALDLAPLYLHPPAAEVQRLRDALENVRLLAARHRKEEWAGHMLRFCADAGVTGSSLREGGE